MQYCFHISPIRDICCCGTLSFQFTSDTVYRLQLGITVQILSIHPSSSTEQVPKRAYYIINTFAYLSIDFLCRRLVNSPFRGTARYGVIFVVVQERTSLPPYYAVCLSDMLETPSECINLLFYFTRLRNLEVDVD